jgi:hypothetical protein
MSKSAGSSGAALSRACVGVRSSWCPNANVHIQGLPYGCGVGFEDTADHNAIRKHVKIIPRGVPSGSTPKSNLANCRLHPAPLEGAPYRAD